jgi:hypothetical protein
MICQAKNYILRLFITSYYKNVYHMIALTHLKIRNDPVWI